MQAVFAQLSQSVMAGSSNLPKALARIHFVPGPSQSYFDEYHFVVRDLFVDLANGIILACVGFRIEIRYICLH